MFICLDRSEIIPGTRNLASFLVKLWTLEKSLLPTLCQTIIFPYYSLALPYTHRQLQLPSLIKVASVYDK